MKVGGVTSAMQPSRGRRIATRRGLGVSNWRQDSRCITHWAVLRNQGLEGSRDDSLAITALVMQFSNRSPRGVENAWYGGSIGSHEISRSRGRHFVTALRHSNGVRRKPLPLKLWTSSRHEDCAMSLKLPLPIPVDGDVERGNLWKRDRGIHVAATVPKLSAVYAIVDPANSL